MLSVIYLPLLLAFKKYLIPTPKPPKTTIPIMPFNIIISPLTNITKGRTLSVSYSVKNRGDKPAFKTNARIYISENKILDENDILLPLQNGDNGEIDPIGPSLTVEKTHRVKVPQNDDFSTGEYYILVDINYATGEDGSRPIEEVDYTNNLAVGRKITVEDASENCGKDIVIENLQVLPNPAFEGSPFTLKFDIVNSGTENVPSFVTKVFTGNPNTDLDDDNLLKKNYNISRLSSNGRLSKTLSLAVPNHLSEDRYCVLVKADATNVIGECDEQNNIVNYCFDVLTRGNDNDISVSDITVSKTDIDLSEDDAVKIGFKVKNNGTTNTATFYCQAYFSPDGEFSKTNDFKTPHSYTIYNIAGGEEQVVEDYQVSIPKDMGNRTYKLFINCDDTGLVSETDENNNYDKFENDIVITGSESGCNADNYELNDDYLTAYEIDLDNDINSTLCDQDTDWYKFNLSVTHKFRIIMEQAFADKDIDLALYKLNDEGQLEEVTVSDSSDSRDSVEKNILTAEDEGVYYLKVYPKNYNSMQKTDYTLQIVYDEVGGEGIDLALKDVMTEDLNNIITNEDFPLSFKVENLRNTPSGNFSIGVYLSTDSELSQDDTILNIIPSTSLSLLENKEFNLTMRLTDELPGGTYNLIVKVDPYDSITETNKDNNIYMKQIMVNFQTTCELDQLDPNSWGEEPLGKVVANGTYENLKLCKNDFDVYLIYLTQGNEFEATLNFNDMEGDIEMRLYKPGSTTDSVASSTTSTDNEHFVYEAEETGFYLLKVYYSWGAPEGAQTYSMTLSGITDGYNFVNNRLDILSSNLSADENSFFKYSITSESTRNLISRILYKVYISSDPILDDEDINVYTESIERMNIGETLEKRIKFRIPADITTGNYYFISKIDVADVIDELNENDNMKIKPATILGQCREDMFESNNSMDEADRNDSIVSLNRRYENLTICPTDKDYYKIYLTNGTYVFINLYFSNSVGDLDMVFYAPDRSILIDSSSETDNEYIQYRVVNSGWYYIRVDGVEYDTNAYTLEILNPSCDNVDCNNGTCSINNTGATICECNEGYAGDDCSVCADGYHDDNGTCVED
jgi:hypothetical protein